MQARPLRQLFILSRVNYQDFHSHIFRHVLLHSFCRYKANLASLQRLVLFQFENDVTVVPKESAHFGFFDGDRVVPLHQSALYLDDRLGLKQLDEGGRLVFEHAPGFHMQFTLEWFGEHVGLPYLAVQRAEAGWPKG